MLWGMSLGSSRLLTLRYEASPTGQQFKNSVLIFLTGQGWRILSESVQPGHKKGGEACCLAFICLPLGFAAGRTPDVVLVNLANDNPPPTIGEHTHSPQDLDMDRSFCVLCEAILSPSEVRMAKYGR